MKEIIKIENLNKYYDTGAIRLHALKNINFTVTEGEYVAIMGQSGSGKSTFMNILGCMDRNFEGKYYLDGIEVSSRKEDELSKIRNKKIGFVFQAFQLIPRMTAIKNVEIPMVYAGMKAEARHKKAAALLEKVGLGEREDHMPNELSGGQKQRVAIARALANDPIILLADEPTGNLDTASSYEIMDFFTQLNKEGATVIVVTHEEDIAAYTNRVVRFKDGEIISDKRNGVESLC